MAATLTPISQPLLIVSLVLLVISAWSRGRVVFGLTTLLSGAAYIFMYVLGNDGLFWMALGLVALLSVGVTIQQWRAMRCATTAPATRPALETAGNPGSQ